MVIQYDSSQPRIKLYHSPDRKTCYYEKDGTRDIEIRVNGGEGSTTSGAVKVRGGDEERTIRGEAL
jgi:hypothetical protein